MVRRAVLALLWAAPAHRGQQRAGTPLVNARAGYAFSKTLKMQLDVFNLFNRKDNDIDYF